MESNRKTYDVIIAVSPEKRVFFLKEVNQEQVPNVEDQLNGEWELDIDPEEHFLEPGAYRVDLTLIWSLCGSSLDAPYQDSDLTFELKNIKEL